MNWGTSRVALRIALYFTVLAAFLAYLASSYVLDAHFAMGKRTDNSAFNSLASPKMVGSSRAPTEGPCYRASCRPLSTEEENPRPLTDIDSEDEDDEDVVLRKHRDITFPSFDKARQR